MLRTYLMQLRIENKICHNLLVQIKQVEEDELLKSCCGSTSKEDLWNAYTNWIRFQNENSVQILKAFQCTSTWRAKVHTQRQTNIESFVSDWENVDFLINFQRLDSISSTFSFAAEKKKKNRTTCWVAVVSILCMTVFVCVWPLEISSTIFKRQQQMMNMNGICKWNIRNICMWMKLIECSMWWKINKYFMFLSLFLLCRIAAAACWCCCFCWYSVEVYYGAAVVVIIIIIRLRRCREWVNVMYRIQREKLHKVRVYSHV